MRFGIGALCVAVGIAANAGCVVHSDVIEDPAPATGGIDVTWQVGAAGCEAAGVQTIRVETEDTTHEVACTAGGTSVDLSAGLHQLWLTGLDAGGRPRYEAQVPDVRVMAGEVTTVPTVILEALPSEITVTWYFDNGRLCGGNGVEDVDLTLFDDDTIVEALTTPCDDGIEALPAVQAGSYTLAVHGRDADGKITWGATRDLDLDKGDARTVEVMLEPW
jgi:hypothetical protein